MKGPRPQADIIDLMRRAATASQLAGDRAKTTGRPVLRPPRGMKGERLALWRALVKAAPLGLLQPEDVHLLERLVNQIAIARQAEAAVLEEGLTVVSRLGEVKRNPALTTLDHSCATIARLAGDLGLGSVVARIRGAKRDLQADRDED